MEHEAGLCVQEPESDEEREEDGKKPAGDERSVIEEILEYLGDFEKLKTCTSAHEVCELIAKRAFVRECIPVKFANDQAVWRALLKEMPLLALFKNLSKLAKLGLLRSEAQDVVRLICERIANEEELRRSCIHPHTVVTSELHLGSLVTTRSTRKRVSSDIFSALESAVRLTMLTQEGSSGKSLMVCVEESPYTLHATASSRPAKFKTTVFNRTCSLAGALAQIESQPEIYFYDDTTRPCKVAHLHSMRMYASSTHSAEIAAPVLYALKEKKTVDAFVIFAGSDAVGAMPLAEAMRSYREAVAPHAKVVVVMMTPHIVTFTDPADENALEVIGFDVNALPTILSFISK